MEKLCSTDWFFSNYFEKKKKIIYNGEGRTMNEKMIKRIPYGTSDYSRMVYKNYYFVDKTSFLRNIETAGDYLFFIRPRRFGKSLFLSMMEGYYDILHKNKFDELFKGTQIYANPTAERNSYLVLHLNFSVIDPDIERVETSFLYYMKEKGDDFLYKYRTFLNIDDTDISGEREKIKNMDSSSDILRSLIDRCKRSHQKLYIIIDEYDNFSNTILTSTGKREYRDLTHGEGFFRTFFNVLKGGTSGLDAPISRLFLTGVSPITLDDVTSGFNIGENISLDPVFNRMLGFTDNDVREMVEYYKSAGLIDHDIEYMIKIMGEWYNNYIFSKNDKTPLFNADMVLYFLKEYFKTRSIPDDLIDRNVRIDYGKLRHLIVIARDKHKTANGNFNLLKQILQDGEIPSDLVKGFSVDKITDTGNFLSLLFYLGLLTVKGVESDELILKIPNETIKRLYYDYISEAYEETDVFSMDLYHYNRLMHAMAYEGEWKPLLDYITGRMRDSMSLRDLITGEKSIQAFLNVYLGLSNIYIVHREKELNKGYADLTLEPFTARYEGIKYAYLMEVKYLKSNRESQKKRNEAEIVQELKTKAEQQLKQYSLDKNFKKKMGDVKLIKLVLVFAGPDLKYRGTVND